MAIEDAWDDERIDGEHLHKYGIRAVLTVPLIVRDRPFGVIYFNCHSAPRTFTEAEVDFAKQLAATASIALENVRLLNERSEAEEQLKTLNETLEAQVAQRIVATPLPGPPPPGRRAEQRRAPRTVRGWPDCCTTICSSCSWPSSCVCRCSLEQSPSKSNSTSRKSRGWWASA